MSKEFEKEVKIYLQELVFSLKKIEVLLKNQSGIEVPGKKHLQTVLDSLETKRESEKKKDV